MLTPSQLQTLKSAIQGDATFNNKSHTSDGAFEIADAMNQIAAPDFWVWRTSVSRAEIYNLVSPDVSTWNWTTYKNQAVAEQNAWTQMFMGDQADFSKANLRAGVASIFTGSAQANAQQAHVLSMGRRLATRTEKLFSTGTGSTVSPATMVFEGLISGSDVMQAMGW